MTPKFEKEINIYRRKEVRRRNKEKTKQNEKDNTRKWHIFVLTGRFCCYFTQQVCLLNKHKSLYSPLISKKVNLSVRRQNEEWNENFCCLFLVFIYIKNLQNVHSKIVWRPHIRYCILFLEAPALLVYPVSIQPSKKNITKWRMIWEIFLFLSWLFIH